MDVLRMTAPIAQTEAVLAPRGTQAGGLSSGEPEEELGCRAGARTARTESRHFAQSAKPLPWSASRLSSGAGSSHSPCSSWSRLIVS